MRDCQPVEGFGYTWSGFVGIDWSGAKGQFIAGIQLAIARPGTTVPETVLPPKNDHWSRQDVMTFLIDQAAQVPSGEPLLVGIDFAFAHPYADCGCYFPDCEDAPRDAAALWQLVEGQWEFTTFLWRWLPHPVSILFGAWIFFCPL